MMLRVQGIPARLVEGYLPGDRGRRRRARSSGGSQAHAWVEAWFPGCGWVDFDPTGGGVGHAAALPAGPADRRRRRPSPAALAPGATPRPTGRDRATSRAAPDRWLHARLVGRASGRPSCSSSWRSPWRSSSSPGGCAGGSARPVEPDVVYRTVAAVGRPPRPPAPPHADRLRVPRGPLRRGPGCPARAAARGPLHGGDDLRPATPLAGSPGGPRRGPAPAAASRSSARLRAGDSGEAAGRSAARRAPGEHARRPGRHAAPTEALQGARPPPRRRAGRLPASRLDLERGEVLGAVPGPQDGAPVPDVEDGDPGRGLGEASRSARAAGRGAPAARP